MRLSENVYILWFSGQKFDSIFRLSEISRFSDRLYNNTIVISFSSDEWDEEKIRPPKTFKPLKQINKWLQQHHFGPLSNLSEAGDLGSNAVLFGGCFDSLDVDEFCRFIQTLKWRSIEDVQLLFWGDNDCKFTVIEFPLEAHEVHSTNVA